MFASILNIRYLIEPQMMKLLTWITVFDIFVDSKVLFEEYLNIIIIIICSNYKHKYMYKHLKTLDGHFEQKNCLMLKGIYISYWGIFHSEY